MNDFLDVHMSYEQLKNPTSFINVYGQSHFQYRLTIIRIRPKHLHKILYGSVYQNKHFSQSVFCRMRLVYVRKKQENVRETESRKSI